MQHDQGGAYHERGTEHGQGIKQKCRAQDEEGGAAWLVVVTHSDKNGADGGV